MNARQTSIVVGVFEDHRHANQAIDELPGAGFTRSEIGVAMRHVEGDSDLLGTGHASQIGSGALTGAVTALGLGTLVGLGVASGMVPIVGPALAAGTLGVILSNLQPGPGSPGSSVLSRPPVCLSMKPNTIRMNFTPGTPS